MQYKTHKVLFSSSPLRCNFIFSMVALSFPSRSYPTAKLKTKLKGNGNVFFIWRYGDLICSYTLSEYISDIYVDGLCIISVKNLIMKSRDFVHRYLFIA